MTDSGSELPVTIPLTVAIDGPSGSGKSSVSRAVARALGLAYLDTGAMYRAAALAVREAGVDPSDRNAVLDLVTDLPLVIGLDPVEPLVTLAGSDVTRIIRQSDVTEFVSRVSGQVEVREVLIARQRAIIAAERRPGGFSGGRGVVAEGRDITTVVAPDAEVRVLLTASPEKRLERRARELHGNASQQAVAATTGEVLDRDQRDSAVTSFLDAAPGVTTVDTSDLTLDESVAAVLAVVRRDAGVNPA